MTSITSRPRRSPSVRKRRKEAVFSVLRKTIGCLALIVMIAAVFKVVMANLWEEPPTAAASSGKTAGTVQPVAAPSLAAASTSPSPKIPRALPLLGLPPSSQPAAEAETATPAAVPAPAPAGASPPPSAASASMADTQIRGMERIEDKRAAISQALQQFFTAASLDEKARTVREPERVRPLMDAYYRVRPLSPPAWKGLGWAVPVDEPGFRLGYVQVLFHDAPPVSIIIEELEDGRHVVDWESSVRYGDLYWSEFLERRPQSPTLMRVIASRPDETRRDTYAPLERGLEVLEIRHPSESGAVSASFNRYDPQMAPLLEQLEAGQWKNVPVTLRLAFPAKSADKNAVLVTSVEGRGWLILPNRRS